MKILLVELWRLRTRMRTFKKRVLFLVPRAHITATGGAGSFTKCFMELAEELNWCVDLCLNLPLGGQRDKEFQDMIAKGRKVYAPDEPMKNNRGLFAFGDSFSLEMMFNFQNAAMKAFAENTYDLIISNVPDATPAMMFLGAADFIPFIHYTHNPNSIYFDKNVDKTYRKCYDNWLEDVTTFKDITCGTQSEGNVDTIRQKYPTTTARCLPMPIPEQALLEPFEPNQEGVMFIGRAEKRKQPEEFVRAVSEAGLKAKVMTKPKDVEKWKQIFQEYDMSSSQYEIKADIFGQEKVDFIRSAKVAYHPALLESYGFSAFETIHTCPTVCLEEHTWYKSFTDFGVYATTKKEASSLLKKLHDETFDNQTQTKMMQEWNDGIPQMWADFLSEKEQEATNTEIRPATQLGKALAKDKIVKLSDYFSSFGRDINMDDVDSIAKKRLGMNVLYTESNTYMSNDPIDPSDIEEEAETGSGTALFEF